ncbi:conserved hypothetical protein [Anaeromyxobacter dehalogenans 2CP-1]|uniref:Uncharacterized protein n=1 Tax=Anaeromyxobacter dehalogenans (strain ATCC BAA-258 / DSM 21875 / 2CP-1) TaxID=455488 RepID=B8JGI2_ANAD2|nr:hypothetical protein [Anaeromyxobacter dehalogenans]ACL64653.1 conserved hypothetical protein [Anaeromyxobacter dehalogenans 2CP-1]
MASITYGSGKLFFKNPTTSQVYQVMEMTDVELSYEGSTKEYYGSRQFPILSVTGQKKVSGKAGTAFIDGRLLSVILSGTTTAGREVLNEVSATGSSATVSPTGTSFAADYGVVDAARNPMNITSSAPAVGAYAVNTGSGMYTFNAAEPDTKTITYAYNTGSGSTFTMKNALQGVQTGFTLFLQQRGSDGELFGVKLNSVVIPGLSFAFKAEDFSVTNLDFVAQVDAAGDLGKAFTE